MVKALKERKTRQTASMEDYLKAIVLLSQEDKGATVTSISKLLGVKKPSVTSALLKLSLNGLVVHKRYGSVELTAEGLNAAQDVYHRHKMLRLLLVEILKVDPKTADEDACRMEHALSPSSLKRLDQFIKFTQNCPQGTPDCLEGFNYYLKHGRRSSKIMDRCQGEKREDEAKSTDKKKRECRR